jgi:hypothetical protein
MGDDSTHLKALFCTHKAKRLTSGSEKSLLASLMTAALAAKFG